MYRSYVYCTGPIHHYCNFKAKELKSLVNKQNSQGKTVLHIAAEMESLAIMEYLLRETNVDINVKDNHQNTALELYTLQSEDLFQSIQLTDRLRTAAGIVSQPFSDMKGMIDHADRSK